MATTTNYGWATPDDTDLVKDGAAAIRTLGSSIDTSLVDLKGGTTGQVLTKASGTDLDFTFETPSGMTNPMTTTGDLIFSSSGSTPARRGIGTAGQVLGIAAGVPNWVTPAATTETFTQIASTSMNGSASISTNVSGYNTYFIHISQATGSDGAPIFIRFNSNSGAVYNSTFLRWNRSASSMSAGNNNSASSIDWGGSSAGASQSFLNMTVNGASGSGVKPFDGVSGANESNGNWYAMHGFFNSTAVITSIQVLTGGGNYTGGTITISGA